MWSGEGARKQDEDSGHDTPVKQIQNGISELEVEGLRNELPKFDMLNFGVDRRMLVNRQRRLKMYRCWMQGLFRKPFDETEEAEAAIRSAVQALAADIHTPVTEE